MANVAFELFQQMYWAYFDYVSMINASKSDEANTNYHYADAATFKNQWADMNTVQGSTGVEIINNNIVDGSTVIKPIKTATDNGMRAAYVIGKVAIDEVTGEVDVTTDGSLFTLAPITDTVNGVLNALGLKIKESAGYSEQEFLLETSRKVAEKILDRQIEDYDELSNIYAGIGLQAATVGAIGEEVIKSYLDQEVLQEVVDTLSDEEIDVIPSIGLADYEIGDFIARNDITPAFNGYVAVDFAILSYLCVEAPNGISEATAGLRDHIDMLEEALKNVIDPVHYPYTFVEIVSSMDNPSNNYLYGYVVQMAQLPKWLKMTEKFTDQPVRVDGASLACNNSDDPTTGSWITNLLALGGIYTSFRLRKVGGQYVVQGGPSIGTISAYGGCVLQRVFDGTYYVAHGICGNILTNLKIDDNIEIDETVLFPPIADIDIEIAYPDWTKEGKEGTRYKDDDDTVVLAPDIPIGLQRALDEDYAGVLAGAWAGARAGVLDPAIPYPDIATITDLYDFLNRIRSIDDARAIDITADPPNTPTPVIPDVPSLSGNAKLYTVHQMSTAQLNALGNYMWSNDFISLIEHMFTNPADAVIGLHTLYYGGSLPVGGAEQIKLGSIEATGVSGQPVTNRYMNFSCGTVHVQSYYGNVEDYEPYTKVQIFLPFIGFRDLNANEVMGGNVTVKYAIDVYTGACVAFITVLRDGVSQALYTFEGNCALTEPLTGADYSRVISGLIGLGVGVATGGVGAAIGAVGMLTNKNIQYTRTGSFSANAGAMGVKVPYIIIRRPRAYDANFYNEFYGNPANNTVTLGSCSGFTRVKDVHVDHISCTDDERAEIVALLKKGVIF